jgi:hypothetical protein
MLDLVGLVGFVASMYFAGELAVQRGRRRTAWLWVAAFIGPLAIPIIYLLPRCDAQPPPAAIAG